MATKANPFQFLQQVRAEVAKVVWPTRREVMLTTVMVFIMAALTAAFFFLVDLRHPHRPDLRPDACSASPEPAVFP